METLISSTTNWSQLTHSIGKTFEARANQHDKEGRFVFENYSDLKALRYFSAAIPEELGGGGATHAEMCTILRILGSYCGSTALALSMHQHLVAAEPDKFQLPPQSDMRYNWVVVRLDAIDHQEMTELVWDAWRMVVPKRVAAEHFGHG